LIDLADIRGRMVSLATLALLALAPGSYAATNVRGWHADGQTWIVWQETTPTPFTCDIYKSTTLFSNISQAELVGRLYPQEWDGERLKLADAELEFTIPDGQGGSYILEPDEGVFVYTPHAAATEFFAVVGHDETAVTPEMTSEAVPQTYDPQDDLVTAHVQWTGPIHNGFLLTIYALWIDGRHDDLARPDLPVMGNGHKNGTPHIFAVAEPPGGVGSGDQPAALLLHGGEGQWFAWRPNRKPQIGIDPVDGYTVQHDDCLYRLVAEEGTGNPVVACTNSWWFGYYDGYDPFVLPPDRPPEDGVVRNYTVRRLEWINDWLIGHRQVDPARIAILGHSMGATGAGLNGRFNPDRYSSVTGFNPTLHVPGGITLRQIFGNENDNLATSLTSAGGETVRMQDVFHPAAACSPFTLDYPFTRYYFGRDDIDPNSRWDAVLVERQRSVDTTACGAHLYWDGRPHTMAEWDGHWSNSEWQTSRDDASAQARYRADLSYPGFFGDDQNPIQPGRQPDPGNGEPDNGDLWGTWGGYFDWEVESITDTVDEWACTLYLAGLSATAVDNCPTASVVTGLAIRKPQQFHPTEGESLDWSLERVSDGRDLKSGSVIAGVDGLVAISGLTIHRDPVRCRLTVRPDGDTISAALICDPVAGTLPFITRLTVALFNDYPEQTRQIAGRIDVTLGNGAHYQYWRNGYTNVAGAGSYIASWDQMIPDLPTVTGENTFRLAAEDITPPPYNQPPYPPAGDLSADECTILAE